ncbi:MAG: hypothetical protein M1820_005646 [Bogoriella megaspora]|nr:MAG: hypothetical protein M1820_005646 [Bogoriella megaspora]
MALPNADSLCAVIDYEDAYVHPLILSALHSCPSLGSCKLITSVSEAPSENAALLQFRAYESINFDLALSHSSTSLINSYIIRKALIRKHYLSTTISSWITKYPGSVLKHHYKPAVEFELDYAEFLDDALTEADAYDLRISIGANLSKDEKDREWWILKPGMSDRGQGIRLFATEDELTAIFEEWEAELPESEDEDVEGDDDAIAPNDDHEDTKRNGIEEREADYIMTSHLRHFIAQPYISNPLLFPPSSSSSEHFTQPPSNTKSHIRTYVLAVGALKLYIYKPMLALFAAQPYARPSSTPNPNHNLRTHLTNTCLQDSNEREGSVVAFWELPAPLPGSRPIGKSEAKPDWREDVFQQICTVMGEVFEAAARGMPTHFQPLPNAFEIFGVDFLVDDEGTAWLLEINAFPDFRQTGEDLKGLVGGLFEEVMRVAVQPFFGLGLEEKVKGEESQERMLKVLDIDLGRR